jgi:hypothetical protein
MGFFGQYCLKKRMNWAYLPFACILQRYSNAAGRELRTYLPVAAGHLAQMA